jgi:hypothetical protein
MSKQTYQAYRILSTGYLRLLKLEVLRAQTEDNRLQGCDPLWIYKCQHSEGKFCLYLQFISSPAVPPKSWFTSTNTWCHNPEIQNISLHILLA